MIYILLENTINGACSLLEELRSKYKSETIVNLTRNTKLTSLDVYATKPLTSAGWLFVCHDCLESNICLRLNALADEQGNMVIFSTNSEKNAKPIRERLTDLKIKYKIINNLHPDREAVIQYVLKNLNTEYDVAEYLCKRCGDYLPVIVDNVYLLDSLEEVTKEDIKRYTKAHNDLPIYSLMDFIMQSDDNMTYSKAIKIVYQYRYGYSHLVSYLQESFKEYVEVYKAINSAELHYGNIASFIKETDNKTVHNLSEYKVRKILNAYSHTSFERLLFLNSHIQTLSKSNSYEVYKLIALLKNLC